MFIESVKISNFRCFGPQPETILLDPQTSVFVGTNGTGKTAAMQALLRLFGITNEQRRINRKDFHIPADEENSPEQRELIIEVVLAFPELDDEESSAAATVPGFFKHMAIDDDGKLKCRFYLKAKWTDDGSLDGAIEQKFWAVNTMAETFNEEDNCREITAMDRARIQMIYVPAVRDGSSQVSLFLKSRLWRAAAWSKSMETTLGTTGQTINTAFSTEPAVSVISSALERRWKEIHSGGTVAVPRFRAIDLQLQDFIKKVDIVFHPDETGRDQDIDDLSDGQRSLFHLAMTAATLDIENQISTVANVEGFQSERIVLPALTLIAVEEPENCLAPFYLSQVIDQIQNLTKGTNAQALISSHSASILSRVDPSMVRHFRLISSERVARVKSIQLPKDDDIAAKFVRGAVRSYPELYFARFVILGEGSSEEVVLPRVAEAVGLPIDRSFIAVVPLGGRHVNHLWKLLTDLEIPYATLLDLDVGRSGGGWGRIKVVCSELLKNGVTATELFGDELQATGSEATLNSFAERELGASLQAWVERLRGFAVYFSSPLDLDWTMLKAFSTAYQIVDESATGPGTGDAVAAVLGDAGDATSYGEGSADLFRWYRYLFLGRSKPNTHLHVLSELSDEEIKTSAPEELLALIEHVHSVVFPLPSVPIEAG